MHLNLSPEQTYHQVLYLGAGELNLNNLPKASQSLHLVDADAEVAQHLAQQVQAHLHAEVKVHNVLIAPTAQTCTYYQYNLSEFNGIAKASALKSLYPGLKTLASEQQPAQGLSDFINTLNLNPQHTNLLVINLPGLVGALLDAIIQTQHINDFSQIVYPISAQPLFEHELNAQHIQTQLQTHGFELQQTSTQDPDFAQHTYTRNPLYAAMQNLQSQQADLAQQLHQAHQAQKQAQEQAQEENQQLQQQLSLQKADHAKATDAMHAQHTQAVQALQDQALQQTQAVKAEHAAQLKTTQAQQAKDQQQIQASQAQVADLQAQLNQQTAAMQTLQSQQAGLVEQLKQSTQQLEHKNAQLITLQTQYTHLQKENAQLQNQNQLQKKEWQHTKKRQKLLEDELIKSQAQIEMIKDLIIQH